MVKAAFISPGGAPVGRPLMTRNAEIRSLDRVCSAPSPLRSARPSVCLLLWDILVHCSVLCRCSSLCVCFHVSLCSFLLLPPPPSFLMRELYRPIQPFRGVAVPHPVCRKAPNAAFSSFPLRSGELDTGGGALAAVGRRLPSRPGVVLLRR